MNGTSLSSTSQVNPPLAPPNHIANQETQLLLDRWIRRKNNKLENYNQCSDIFSGLRSDYTFESHVLIYFRLADRLTKVLALEQVTWFGLVQCERVSNAAIFTCFLAASLLNLTCCFFRHYFIIDMKM